MLRSRIRLAAMLAAAALVLAACGGGDDDSGGSSGAASSGELKVFAAASLTAAFTKIGDQYAAANGGDRVTFNFAGSQALATQIQQGAPADVLASADIANMDKVKDLVGTPENFASNLLAMVVEKGNPKDVRTLDDLANPGLKVVLAAPEVPAGKYAAEILGRAGVTVKPVSQEDNVKAVVTKVSLGEADAGIVYVTDVTAGGDKVEGVDIPEEQNVVATYPIATIKASKDQQGAEAFMDLVLSAEGQQVLKEYGFLPPPTT
ncbi:MAG TPA: molybdate ABC transporter substrate-binding protein [Actinomycetota bacterium]|nr:molybdate ABC transporter substrate-binding protein [Actinomycetota bacterium]